MRAVLTHRIDLQPNPIQGARLRQCARASRLAYNWGAEWHHHEWVETLNEAASRRRLTLPSGAFGRRGRKSLASP